MQKGNGKKLSKDAIALLRKNNLVEGRQNSLYLSAEVAKSIDEEADYIKKRAFDDQYYRDLIIKYLNKYGHATKAQLRNLIIDKLPDSLNDDQKEGKVGNLLTSLRKKELIEVVGHEGRQPIWALKKHK